MVTDKGNGMVKSAVTITVLAWLLLCGSCLVAPPLSPGQQNRPNVVDQLVFTTPAVPRPSVSVGYSGESGSAEYCYWVVAEFTAGSSPPSSPACVQNVGELSSVNSVSVTWGVVEGASQYKVVRTLGRSLGATCSSCLLTTTTDKALTDDGTIIPGTFTQSGVIGQSQATVELDHTGFSPPRLKASRPFTAGSLGAGTPTASTVLLGNGNWGASPGPSLDSCPSASVLFEDAGDFGCRSDVTITDVLGNPFFNVTDGALRALDTDVNSSLFARNLTFTSEVDDADAAGTLNFRKARNGGAPASVGDVTGELLFRLFDDGSSYETGARIYSTVLDNAAGNVDADLLLQTVVGGTLATKVAIDDEVDVTGNLNVSGVTTTPNVNTVRYCDQFASLQACHDDLPAGGGMMIVPAGTYTLTSQLAISKSNVLVQCAGIGNTIIQRGAFGADTTTVAISGSKVAVRDCTFDGNAIATSFALVVLSDNDILFQANEIFEPEQIGISVAGFSRVKILDNRITGNAATGSVNNFGIWHDNTSNTDLLIQGNTIRGMAANAIFGSGTRVTITENQILDNHYNTGPGGGQIALDDVSDVLIEGNTIGPGGGIQTSGIELDAGGGPAGQRITISNNTIRGQNWQGIATNSSGIEDLIIANNIITNSGTASVNQPAIDIPAGMSNFQILGNRIFDDQGTQTQTYAVDIATGASDFYIITDNDFHGNKTGGINDNGTGSNKVVADNLQ